LFEHVAMRFLDLVELRVGSRERELRRGFALEDRAELERVADQLDIDACDLQPALRRGLEKSLGFEPRDHLANRAERQTERRGELGLRYELTGPNARRDELLLKSLVRLPAQSAGIGSRSGSG